MTRGIGMLIELAKPVTFMVCILSLYGVFYAAFLNPLSDFDERVYESLILLALAAGISVVSAMIFREAKQGSHTAKSPLTAMLPLQMFCWAAGVMVILFFVSWYLETYVVFYRDLRWY